MDNWIACTVTIDRETGRVIGAEYGKARDEEIRRICRALIREQAGGQEPCQDAEAG